MSLWDKLSYDVELLIYSFNAEHREKLKETINEINKCKNFVIWRVYNYPVTIIKYAIKWKNKGCFEKGHTIEISKPFGVLCRCRDCGETQGFNYRDSSYHYRHLPKYLR
jgi:hypothetical protein